MTIESSKINGYAVVGNDDLTVTKVNMYAVVNPDEPMYISKIGKYAVVFNFDQLITLSENIRINTLNERLI